jgi:GT2 family glycosyltransferase
VSAAVDLIIPNLDGEALLGTCLAGVAAQTLAPARVIVVDSGSTDGSRAITETHGAEWHQLPDNNGFAAAVNHGIATSDSPYVALLNNDAVPEPRWLAALVEALERDTELSFAASRMLFTGERGMNAAGDAFDVRGRGGYNRGTREPDGPRFDEPRIVFGACAGAALYRRGLFDDVGLFDERFFLSWEDVDLDLRAALAGHRCLYVPSAIVHHVQGASSGEWRAALERRNKAILALKGLPLPLLALYLALLPVREAYETRAAREGVTGYLRRLAPYASEAPRALRMRGEVRRCARLRELWPLLTRESLPYEPRTREDVV